MRSEMESANFEASVIDEPQGKCAVVASHLTYPEERLFPPALRPYTVPYDGGFKVSGFVLGTVVRYLPEEGTYLVFFPALNTMRSVSPDSIIRILLDDEAEPSMVGSLPRLTPP